jgi:hypothetical protein
MPLDVMSISSLSPRDIPRSYKRATMEAVDPFITRI